MFEFTILKIKISTPVLKNKCEFLMFNMEKIQTIFRKIVYKSFTSIHETEILNSGNSNLKWKKCVTKDDIEHSFSGYCEILKWNFKVLPCM